MRTVALVVLAVIVFALSPTPVAAQSAPDPTLLPVATTSQVPLRSAYDVLNVPSLPAGSFYFDPTTGVKVYRLTSSTFPKSGVSRWTHDYSEGGNEISLPYTGDGVTRAILVRSGNSSGPYWIVDFTPGVGVSNPRALGGNDPCHELAFTFSNNPATPYYAYVGNCNKILRIDLRTMSEAPGNGWPVTGNDGTDTYWLHQSENDGVFTWMVGSSTNVRAYQPSTGILRSHNDAAVDEPRIERSGRFVGLSRGNPNNSLAVWDWQANTVTWTTSGDPGMIFAHVGSLRGRWLTSDFNDGFHFDRYIPDGTTSTRATFLPGPLTGSTAYVSGNWINYPASGNLDDQWALTYYYGGIQAPSGYLAPGGTVYMTASSTNPQRRLVFHGYNTQTQYGYWMSAKSSSDGRYIVFNSDMNGSGRVDVFLAEMPVSGGSGSGSGGSGGNPVPALSSLSPASATVGGAALTLTVNGSSFVNGSVVQWNGGNRATTFLSSTRLTAAVTAADIATAGTAAVRVFTSTPGGGTSSAMTFTIGVQGNPLPALTAISPSSATAGGAGFTLTVTGASFVNGSVVQWGGAVRTTTFVSSTQLAAAISAADIAAGGTKAVTIFSPTPGGGTSGAMSFSTRNPMPVASSISPNSAAAGGQAFTITVTGSDFVPGSVVQFDDGNRATTFVSGTQLKATILAVDILGAGNDRVTVLNPGPGGGTSTVVPFTTNTGGTSGPRLTSLSPSSVTAGGAAFTLTVNGSNFISGSTVRWNGVDRTTTFVSATQLKAAITATDVAAGGTASVTVVTATTGATSGALTFTITGGTGNPPPTLTSVSPSTATAGGAGFTLTVTGTNFVNGSVVQWGGAVRTTTFVSSTQLRAAISAADIATGGTKSVTVFSPAPGGGTSSALTFTTRNPVPVATSISPNSAAAGGQAFTITVTGSNFVPGSVVQFDDGNRVTTFVSSTQLKATILAVDILGAGNDRVMVLNPGPGGGTSAVVPFTTR